MFGDVRDQVVISCSARKLYHVYNGCKGSDKRNLPFRFWDVVVLTASDNEQKKAYQMQIDQMIHSKEVILGVDFVIIADVVGTKMGCGGATMNVISELKKSYGDSFSSLYILIINAGGYSQRLPCSSALGKIFTALPFGFPMWTLLDLKLASYIPFLQRMQPGIFHAASDTIELIHIDEKTEFSDWNFYKNGLTAIAHPSAIEIGETHGVFVPSMDFKVRYPNQNRCSVMFLDCCEVLQKPSQDDMNKKQAILEVESKDSILTKFVYTDSCFFIDQEFVEALSNYFEREKPLTCEIDAYGDFMRCLGQGSCHTLKNDVKNAGTANAIATTREKLYACLHKFKLNVLAFNDSQFFHLGTMREYIDNLTRCGSLFNIIGFQQQAFTTVSESGSEVSKESTLIHSLFESKIQVMHQTVLEYCHFACEVQIGSCCIVSNCSVVETVPDFCLIIPSNLFIHTVPITDEANLGYVTIIYGIDDDIKLNYENSEDVCYIGKPLKEYCLPDKQHLQGTTLWDVPLFSCFTNPTDSLIASLNLVNSGSLSPQSLKKYSARSIMQLKNVEAMLEYRKYLNNRILNQSSSV